MATRMTRESSTARMRGLGVEADILFVVGGDHESKHSVYIGHAVHQLSKNNRLFIIQEGLI